MTKIQNYQVIALTCCSKLVMQMNDEHCNESKFFFFGLAALAEQIRAAWSHEQNKQEVRGLEVHAGIVV